MQMRSVSLSLAARPSGSAAFAAYSAVVKWNDSMITTTITVEAT